MNNSTIKEIAIGGFDGMHLAHQHLFNALDQKTGAVIAIETGYANLTPHRAREEYTHLPIFYFNLDDIRHLDDEGFMNLLSQTFPNLEKIVVGYDFYFGKDRLHNHQTLKHVFKNGSVEVIDKISIANDSVHSHKIRKFIEDGEIKKANKYLAHNYTIEGNIIHGQGIGKKELYATINIETFNYILPKEGVYATLTQFDDEEHFHKSVSFIGHRKTTDGSFAIETHIIDEEIEASKKAKISFVSFLRENKKFETLEELRNAIQNDIKSAKKAINPLAL